MRTLFYKLTMILYSASLTITLFLGFTNGGAQDPCNGIKNRYVCNPYVPGGFMICVNGMKHEFKCSGGLNFNSKTQTCDWPHKADCTEEKHAINAPAAAKPPKAFKIELGEMRRSNTASKRREIQEDEPMTFKSLTDRIETKRQKKDDSEAVRIQDEEERHLPLIKPRIIEQKPRKVQAATKTQRQSALYPVTREYDLEDKENDELAKKRIWSYKISKKIASPNKRYKQGVRKMGRRKSNNVNKNRSKNKYRVWNIREKAEKRNYWTPKPDVLRRKPVKKTPPRKTPKRKQDTKYKSIKKELKEPIRRSKYITPRGKCHPDSCKPPNCQCASHEIPLGIPKKETPMMVMLTFDDGVNSVNMPYYDKLLSGHITNPNGCEMKSTFFVSGDATNYDFVSTLHAKGHEIASHSISHRMPQSWWAAAGYQGFKSEIEGMRQRLATQSKIPVSDIKGMRAPFLQIGGDGQYEMLADYKYKYDTSFLTGHPYKNNRAPVWPFTLDYPPDSVYCSLPPCPTKSYPGLWEVPLIRWYGSNNVACAMPDGCVAMGGKLGTLEYLRSNFNRHYSTNRAPLGIFLHASWFKRKSGNFDALMVFLEELSSMDDVWLLSVSQVVDWMRNPTPLSRISDMQSWKC